MAKRIKRKPAVIENGVVTFDVSTEAHPDTWALVDLEDWPLVDGHRWSATKRKNGLYVRNWRLGLLHQHLAGDGRVVDHRDGGTLNNRRQNLRPCSQGDNSRFGTDRRRGYSVVTEVAPVPTREHVVTMRLADGSERQYRYPTRSKTGTKEVKSRKRLPYV